MRREIKFRAWDGARHYYPRDVAPTQAHDRLDGYTEKSTFYLPMSFLVGDANDWTWEQFTGLEDKNGTEIYEGDVLEYLGEPYEVRFGKQDVGHDFQGIGFYLCAQSNGRDDVFNIFGGDNVEVIGNVHQNPRLLK